LSAPETLRPTHVVTCFLERADEQPPHILIVRRSQRVGSYHGRWAGISGFVEPNVTPDEQAYVEIAEETSLLPEQVRILKRGKVVEHRDEELRRHFYIHPFLFRVFAPEHIKIDWEASEMRWIQPSELLQYETVPKLPEAFASAISGEIV
jgi:ADP-ribose pyrophosphatase YjhB (NUDIX family)